MGEDFVEHPTERMQEAERRREFRRLLDASSLGTPGAQAMRKRGRGEELTSEEEAAVVDELRELERWFERKRGRRVR